MHGSHHLVEQAALEEKRRRVEQLELEVQRTYGVGSSRKISVPSERLTRDPRKDSRRTSSPSPALSTDAKSFSSGKVRGCSSRLLPVFKPFTPPPPLSHLPLLAERRAKSRDAFSTKAPQLSEKTVNHLYDNDLQRRGRNAARLKEKIEKGRPVAKTVLRSPEHIRAAGVRMCDGAMRHKKQTLEQLAARQSGSACSKAGTDPRCRKLTPQEQDAVARRLCDGSMEHLRCTMRRLVRRYADGDHVSSSRRRGASVAPSI